MAFLGIESTAHTFAVGIVEEDPGAPGRLRVLANERAMVRPPPPQSGEAAMGIHPREAANHHADVAGAVLARALEAAGVAAAGLEGVAFSQGPGLGPCLRVGATVARALCSRHRLALAGVNHCVAHLEVGRGATGAADPLMLYASGANTQLLAAARGRYRVFGETLDIGLGNALDKFARDNGVPFPGGPEVERLALQADAATLLPLPYTVKGMDLSFSGLATAAQRLVDDGHALPQVCHALQEHAFAALVEVAERALAYTGRGDLLLAGGVACNQRLQQMARAMADERGADVHVPPRDLLVDNGAMIAWTGLRLARAGRLLAVADSQVRPYERPDAVDVPWQPVPAGADPGAPRGPAMYGADGPVARGAEAVLLPSSVLGRRTLRKMRLAKAYRHAALDARLRANRTRDEGRAIAAARVAGARVPILLDADRGATALELERVEAPTLREALAGRGAAAADSARGLLRALGHQVARLHAAGILHGDLTPANVLVDAAGPVLIDFGLAGLDAELEGRAVDLHILEEALEASDARAGELFGAFLEGYGAASGSAVLGRLQEIRERGRYR